MHCYYSNVAKKLFIPPYRFMYSCWMIAAGNMRLKKFANFRLILISILFKFLIKKIISENVNHPLHKRKEAKLPDLLCTIQNIYIMLVAMNISFNISLVMGFISPIFMYLLLLHFLLKITRACDKRFIIFQSIWMIFKMKRKY